MIYAKNLDMFTVNLKAININEDNTKEGDNI